MLGYMSKKKAIEEGFTNHGKYYGIPVYIRNDVEFEVNAKWYPMNYLVEFLAYLEMLLGPYVRPEQEGFKFLMGPELRVNKDD